MNRINVTVADKERNTYYVIHVTPEWFKKHNNGHMFSLGLSIPEDISRTTAVRLPHTLISYENWKHSGCLSRCVKRGDSLCRY